MLHTYAAREIAIQPKMSFTNEKIDLKSAKN
jgi:hypothetical protein